MTPAQLRQALRDNPPESEASRQARAALLQLGEPLVPAVEILSVPWVTSGEIIPIGEVEEWEEIRLYAHVPIDPVPEFQGFGEYARMFKMEWGKSFDYYIVANEIY